jgi:hypothetical protein
VCDVLKTQLLGALKDSLHGVEEMKLIPGSDFKLPLSGQDLRKTITAIENDGARENESDVAP